jgi:hypothetical protein
VTGLFSTEKHAEGWIAKPPRPDAWNFLLVSWNFSVADGGACCGSSAPSQSLAPVFVRKFLHVQCLSSKLATSLPPHAMIPSSSTSRISAKASPTNHPTTAPTPTTYNPPYSFSTPLSFTRPPRNVTSRIHGPPIHCLITNAHSHFFGNSKQQ